MTDTEDDPDRGSARLALAARVQAALEGVRLPATRQELISYAEQTGADAEVIAALRARCPDRAPSLDVVGEGIAPVQPQREPRRPRTPTPGSGAPPGGGDYITATSSAGLVRDETAEGPDDPRGADPS